MHPGPKRISSVTKRSRQSSPTHGEPRNRTLLAHRVRPLAVVAAGASGAIEGERRPVSPRRRDGRGGIGPVIVSPPSHCYLDIAYAELSTDPGQAERQRRVDQRVYLRQTRTRHRRRPHKGVPQRTGRQLRSTKLKDREIGTIALDQTLYR